MSDMRAQLEQRLEELRAEFEKGQQALQELDERRASIRETLLRISGAIQVLEETLQGAATPPAPGEGPLPGIPVQDATIEAVDMSRYNNHDEAGD